MPSSQLLLCKYCLSVLNEPKLLDCLHAVCFECCKKIISEHSKIICPLCDIQMNVTDASLLPNSPLHSLLLGEQAQVKMKCKAAKCTEAAIWQMEDTGAAFCDTHKQQMTFVSFVPLETMIPAMTQNCTINDTHGLASKYCKQCEQSLCDKCAFYHASHGAIDLLVLQHEFAKHLADKLKLLNKLVQQTLPNYDKARVILKKMELVLLCNFPN